MHRIGRALVCFAVLTLSTTAAIGQSTARINGIRGAVEIVDRTGAAVGLATRPVVEQDTIRTGGDSTVTLVIGTDISIVLGERTEVGVRKLGINSAFWLESGNIQVSSRSSAIQIQTKSGWFSAEEWPFEMDLVNQKETTNVTVTAGAIKTQNLDTSSVTFRAAGNNAYRTYTVGGNRQHDTKATDEPPLFIRPNISIGGQSNSQTPAATAAPGAKSPSPNH